MNSENNKTEELDKDEREERESGPDNSKVDAGGEAKTEETESNGGVSTEETTEETIEKLKSELESVRREAEEERDRLLRLSAEFENYKKRMDRHFEEYKKYANESLLKELLTVVDNLERAISSTDVDKSESSEACVVEGVEMTLNEILKILRNFNVVPIEAKGKPFNPVYHEAMMQEETDEYPENTVIGELQKGYLLHDRLLRPAMVVVSKAKTKE